MESNIANEQFDNKYALTYDNAVNFFLSSIHELFEDYLVSKTENFGMSFKLEYQLDDYKFLFRSEKGYIEEYLLMKNDKISNLLNFQPLLKNVEVVSKKNVLFLLVTIKQYIDAGKA